MAASNTEARRPEVLLLTGLGLALDIYMINAGWINKWETLLTTDNQLIAGALTTQLLCVTTTDVTLTSKPNDTYTALGQRLYG
jgi:hypothetical protein